MAPPPSESPSWMSQGNLGERGWVFQFTNAVDVPLTLTVKLADMDILSSDDIIGERTLDITYPSEYPSINWHDVEVTRQTRNGGAEPAGRVKLSVTFTRSDREVTSEVTVYSWVSFVALDLEGLSDTFVTIQYAAGTSVSKVHKTPVQFRVGANQDKTMSILSRVQWSTAKTSAYQMLQQRLGQSMVRLEAPFSEAFERFRFDRGVKEQCDAWVESHVRRLLNGQGIKQSDQLEAEIDSLRRKFVMNVQQVDEAAAFGALCEFYLDSFAGPTPAPDLYVAAGMRHWKGLLSSASPSVQLGILKAAISTFLCLVFQLTVPLEAIWTYTTSVDGDWCPDASPILLKLASASSLALFGILQSSATASARQIGAFGPSVAFSQSALLFSSALNILIANVVCVFTFLLFIGMNEDPSYTGIVLNMLAASYVGDLDDLLAPLIFNFDDDELRQYCLGSMFLSFATHGERTQEGQWARNFMDGWGGGSIRLVITVVYLAVTIFGGICV